MQLVLGHLGPMIGERGPTWFGRMKYLPAAVEPPDNTSTPQSAKDALSPSLPTMVVSSKASNAPIAVLSQLLSVSVCRGPYIFTVLGDTFFATGLHFSLNSFMYSEYPGG